MRGTSADQVLPAADAAAPRTATSTTMITSECANTSGTVHATSSSPALIRRCRESCESTRHPGGRPLQLTAAGDRTTMMTTVT
jgi:hypothetical protein